VAFQAMRLEVGKALQPLGAELQGAFAKFITEITPAVVSSAKAIAAVLSFFTTNEAAGGLARYALQLGAVALAIKGLQAASAGLIGLNIASWFTGAATAAKVTSSGMEVAAAKTITLKGALAGLGTAFKALLPFAVLTFSLDIIIRNFSQLKETEAAIRKIKEDQSTFRPGLTGPVPLNTAERRFAGASRETVADVQQRNQTYIAKLRKDLVLLERQARAVSNVVPDFNPISRGLQLFGLNPTENYEQQKKAQVELQKLKIQGVEEVLNLELGGYKTQAEIEKARLAALSNKFPSPAGEDKDKAADKARRDAEAAAADQQRLNEAIAKARIALADAVFRNDMELIRKRYEYEQELEGKKRDLAVRSKTGGARESAALISSYFGELQTLTNRLTEAGQAVETATQDLKLAKEMAATTMSPTGAVSAAGRYMQGGIGPMGPNQYGPHFDIKRSDGGYYSRNALDRYVQVNGRPLSSGVTVPGGEYGAPRSYGGHAGWDYAFGGSAAMTLTGGAKWMGSQKGSYGDAAAFMTPDGKVYKVIHGKFEGAAGAGAARQPTGVAAAIRRDVSAEGGVSTAEANLDKARGIQAMTADQVKKLASVAGESFVVDFTASIREQNAALADSASITELRNRLQLAGERPETIEAEIRKAEVLQRSTQLTGEATAQLELLTAAGQEGSERANFLRDAIANQNTEIAKFKELTDAATAAQIKFNDAQRFRQDDRIGLGMQEGVQSYVESIGTMRDATKELTVNGIKGVENAIFDLVTTGKTNFREFAADILRQTARMIIQQLILGTIMRGIKALFPGFADGGVFAPSMQPRAGYAMGGAFAKNNIVPYAKGGTFTNSIVSKPTLFKFAAGGTMQTGVMGEAGPEAIMPLSRGPNGKLGVASSGSGSTNVTVNVDASGSKAQGDSTKSEQLGRAVSQAVQDELLKQRRPGGLLA
jgi:lambda family phage tail tape measure protein